MVAGPSAQAPQDRAMMEGLVAGLWRVVVEAARRLWEKT